MTDLSDTRSWLFWAQSAVRQCFEGRQAVWSILSFGPTGMQVGMLQIALVTGVTTTLLGTELVDHAAHRAASIAVIDSMRF